MNTDRNTIFYRYWTALSDDTITDTFNGEYVPAAAVRLALRLAIQDACEAGPALASDLSAIVASQDKALQTALDQVDQLRKQCNAQPDTRALEAAQAQISRLAEWLSGHSPALYYSPDLDTAGAILQHITSQAAQIAGLHAQILQLDADNADLIASSVSRETHPANNGAVLDPTPAAHWGRNHPAWAALPAGDFGAIDQLSSGQIKFRNLTRTLRRDLVHRVIRSLAVDGQLGSSKYDQQRPPWMPTSGSVIMLSSNGHWSSLLAAALNQTQAQPVEAN